ncbi:D-alanyl-D-alanine carboxypeptidase family protein [Hyphobacterium sp. HN65]|uniref:D-alanyl-D-alanine carboxypeptidase family protein n=1 Tax=Hyphobacterium lacteum TaxID=3116575 RepID=A0ABU7LMP4_9PROT|nr:D-alanyl-D-alanine carboxypeptidase family protein [Hyphobacterium sp. HN65]MEE2525147.1 D-alanyl-D-alanine carboxypeptidase family protein [Hyphobacterium sp. HN65]
MAFLVALSALLSGEAQADTRRYAAFVADANTGEILHSRLADARRYPASLTKMMTLYLLFEAIESGELSLSDTLTVSRIAAGQQPSNLDLDEGDTLTVETAIRALIIKSANDVAVVVAEELGGTERAFAVEMTARARELGLSNTTFRNASGLPNSRQVTTARDMARLTIALRRDFPQYMPYFSERSFTYDGRTYRSHNNLIGRVEGVDGMKTGYIRASGFNIATTAQRGDRRLVAVVMGGPTAAYRDTHAEQLIEAAFRSLDNRQSLIMAARTLTPRLNPIREQDLLATHIASLDLSLPVAQGDGESLPPLRVEMSDDLGPAPGSLREPTLTGLASDWSVQVGAYADEAAARARLETVQAMTDDLAEAALYTPRFETNGRTVFRARFTGVGAESARRICAHLATLEEPCFAVAPGG